MLQLALTVAVTYFIVRRVGLGMDDLAALARERWRPRWGTLLLSCIALAAGYVTSAAIWGRMVAGMGGPRLPLLAASEVYLVANLGRYVPGKLWQVAGLAVLAKQRGVPVAVSTGAAVLGQALALGGAALVGASALLGPDAPSGAWIALLLGGLVVIVAFALIPALQRPAIRLWFRLAREGPPTLTPSGATTLGWLALYALNWVLYGAAFYLLARSFGLPGSPLLVAPAFAAAYVLGYAALFAPAGIGVREGFLVVFLTPVMGVAEAGALSLIARLWTTIVEVIPAGLLWALHVRRTLRGEGEGEPSVVEAPPVAPPGSP